MVGGYTPKEDGVTLPHYQLPADLGPYLDKIILAYDELAKPSTSEEFAKKDKELGKSRIVGRGLAYLMQLGLVVRKGQGKYDLTAPGQIIRKALVSGGSGALQAWQFELTKHRMYAMMKDYLKEMAGAGTAVGFGNYVRSTLGKTWGKQFTDDGGRRICSLYGSKELVNYDQAKGSFSLKATAATSGQNVDKHPEGAETALLYVGYDVEGGLNVKVSKIFEREESKQIIDLVLGSKSLAGLRKERGTSSRS